MTYKMHISCDVIFQESRSYYFDKSQHERRVSLIFTNKIMVNGSYKIVREGEVDQTPNSEDFGNVD